MTTNFHTPYEDDVTEFKASHMNVPLGELDEQLTYIGEIAEGLVASVNIDLSPPSSSGGDLGQTTIYTVPAGKRFVPTKVIFVAGDDCGESVISIGQQGATTDFVPAQSLKNLDAQYDAAVIKPLEPELADSSASEQAPVASKSYAAGTVIECDVIYGDGGATNSLKLMGILY